MARTPAEELVRDYLSRLTAATRGELDAADRRALVDRTREFIDQQVGLSGRPDPMDVAKLLARLGDPSGLVRDEQRRLADLRGDDLGASQQHRMRVGRTLRRDARALGATWHWPTQEGQPQLRLTLIEGGQADDGPSGEAAVSDGATSDAGPADLAPASTRPAPWPQRPALVPVQPDDPEGRSGRRPGPGNSDADTVLTGTVLNGRVLPGAGASGTAADDGSGFDGPGFDGPGFDGPGFEGSGFEATGFDRAGFEPAGFEPAGFDDAGFDAAGFDGAEYEIPASESPDGDSPPSGDWEKPDSGGWLLNEIAGPAELLEPAESGRQPMFGELAERLARSALGFARTLPHRWRQHPVEMSALLLLGPGGLIFPPVWLLGAAVALASKLWHPLDKWAGLATPVLLTTLAAVLGVIFAGSTHFGHDVHEGWEFAVAASRLSAVASACYLAWRARLGRRPTPVPPWKKGPGVG